MSNSFVKQECPTCRGTGLNTSAKLAENERVVCLACEGKGWRALAYRSFVGRRAVVGVDKVFHSLAQCLPPDAIENGNEMDYDEFVRRFTPTVDSAPAQP